MSDLKQRAWSLISKMDGWADESQVCGMIDLVMEHKPVTIVESGVFGGRSCFALAMACDYVGMGTVWGIDPWSNDAALEGDNGQKNDEWWASLNLEQIYRNFIQNVLALEISHRLNWLRMKSEIAIRLFPAQSIGILRTDSNHSELVSCQEVEMWHDKVVDKGIWIWDDTDWPSQSRALAMVQEKGFKLIGDHGKWQVFQRI